MAHGSDRKTENLRSRLSLELNVILISMALLPHAYALPVGPMVVAGSASFQSNGPMLTITLASPAVVINWGSFSIQHGETVSVLAPVGWGVLNRSTGPDPSILSGGILTSANFGLVNSQGMTVSAQATLSTGDMLLSAVNVSDQNFLAQSGDFQSFMYQWSGIAGALAIDGVLDVVFGDSMHLAASVVTAGGTSLLRAGNIYIDTVAPVPEPASYAFLLAGLGVLGFSAHRRKQWQTCDAASRT